MCTGKHLETVHSRKYGCAHIRFTHDAKSVIYASSRGDSHALRYHSLHDNKYLRYFAGHTGPVTGVAVSAVNDMLLSTAADRSVRLWDLRSASQIGVMKNAPCKPCAAFDYQGMIFALSTDPGLVKLYDMRNYQGGHFMNVAVPGEAGAAGAFAHLAFSFDGKRILGVAESRVHVMDAFEGSHLCLVSTAAGAAGGAAGAPASGGQGPAKACFTPDGSCVVSGCEDGAVRFWKVPGQAGAEMPLLHEVTGHAGRPNNVCFSTRRMVMASSCHQVALSVPDLQGLRASGALQGAL